MKALAFLEKQIGFKRDRKWLKFEHKFVFQETKFPPKMSFPSDFSSAKIFKVFLSLKLPMSPVTHLALNCHYCVRSAV